MFLSSCVISTVGPAPNFKWRMIRNRVDCNVIFALHFYLCIVMFACLHVCMFALHVFALHLCIAAVFPHWFLEMLPGLVRS